jgi:hypothetical protein
MPRFAPNKMPVEVKRRYFELIREGWSGALLVDEDGRAGQAALDGGVPCLSAVVLCRRLVGRRPGSVRLRRRAAPVPQRL